MNIINKHIQNIKKSVKFLCLMGLSMPFAQAAVLPLSPQSDVIGQEKYVTARANETLLEVARRHSIGYDEIMRANPQINAQSRLSANARVYAPSRFILPPGPREGMVINLAELRLYYYPPGRNVVVTEPIAIGREGWTTPTGETKVKVKEKDPYWHAPASVRAEAARNGTPIADVFPPGPDNPMGKYKIRLDGTQWSSILIHGTNRPEVVGSRVSAGCIRLLPEDIEELYNMVPVGTPVRIINEPFKAGWSGGQLYFEAHYPLAEDREHYAVNMTSVVKTVTNKIAGRQTPVRWSVVENAAKRPTGLPLVIS